MGVHGGGQRAERYADGAAEDWVTGGQPGVWSAFESAVIEATRNYCDDPRSALEGLVNLKGLLVPGATEMGPTHTFPSARSLATVTPSAVNGLTPQAAAAIRALAASETPMECVEAGLAQSGQFKRGRA